MTTKKGKGSHFCVETDIYDIRAESGQIYTFRDEDGDQTIDEKEGPYKGDRYLRPGTEAYQTALEDLHLKERGSFVGLRLADDDPRTYAFDPIFLSGYQTITLGEYEYLLRQVREINIPERHYDYPFLWTDSHDWRSRVWGSLFLNRFEENGFDPRDFNQVLLAENTYQKLKDCHTTTAQGIIQDILTADLGPWGIQNDVEGFEEHRRLVVELQQAESRAKGEPPGDIVVLADQFDQIIGYPKLLRAYAVAYERMYYACFGVFSGDWWNHLTPEELQKRLTHIQEQIDHYHHVLGKTPTQIAQDQQTLKERILANGISSFEWLLFNEWLSPNPLAEQWKQLPLYKGLLHIGQELGLDEAEIQRRLLALLNPPKEIVRLIPEAQTLSPSEKRAALRNPKLGGEDILIAIGHTLSFQDEAYKEYDPEMRLFYGCWGENPHYNREVRRLAGHYYQQYLKSGKTSSRNMAHIFLYAGYDALFQEESFKVVQDKTQPIDQRLAALYFAWGRLYDSRTETIELVREIAKDVKTKNDFYLVLRSLISWNQRYLYGSNPFEQEARVLYESDWAIPYRSPEAAKLVKRKEEEMIPKIKAEKIER